ncbi:MAG TPA: efflux transporter periplasmic adaptor subunit [Pseudohongiella sp.]|nr:efflux transporter periplasmic adaptor subunit [Pseudohongiella sp.]HBX38282.1 efflux transporter periplasmic adaptor subunit [Pseudohongiella sp.]
MMLSAVTCDRFGSRSAHLQFVTRHPLLIFFLLAVSALTYGVFAKLQSDPAAGGPPGMGRGPGGPGGMAAPSVTVAIVETGVFVDQVESVGTAQANESLSITPKVSDIVTGIYFEDGDFVERGDVLVELTNSAETARLSEAQTALDDARRQRDRMEQLSSDNLVSRLDLDNALSQVETAQARLEGVVANMRDRVIVAPFSGVLGFRNISEGAMVSPNTEITTLDDISTIKLDFNVSESFLAQLESGLQVTAHSIVYPNRSFVGDVEVIGSRVDVVTRSVPVRAVIDNPDGALRPGMLLTVGLMLNERETIVIPEQSVVPAQGRQYVYVVDEEELARRVEVQLGARRPGVVEVLSGLVPGQRVVAEGVAQVRPNQRVRILNTLPATTSNTSSAAAPGNSAAAASSEQS